VRVQNQTAFSRYELRCEAALQVSGSGLRWCRAQDVARGGESAAAVLSQIQVR